MLLTRFLCVLTSWAHIKRCHLYTVCILYYVLPSLSLSTHLILGTFFLLSFLVGYIFFPLLGLGVLAFSLRNSSSMLVVELGFCYWGLSSLFSSSWNPGASRRIRFPTPVSSILRYINFLSIYFLNRSSLVFMRFYFFFFDFVSIFFGEFGFSDFC